MDFSDSTKTCSTCGQTKPLSAFYDKQRQCRACKCAKEKAKRATLTDEQRAKARKWRKEYKRKQRRQQGRMTAEQRSMLRKNNKAWKEMISFLRTSDRIERKTPTPAERYRTRYRTDPQFRAKQIMRTLMRKSAKKYGWIAEHLAHAAKGKSQYKRIWEIVGYTPEQLIQHLQRQFTKGMTIDHFMRGEIHIDHIIPKSTFKLDTIEDVRACHALYNLRPMWAKDNMRKAASVQSLL